jgi:hypothetical protein
LILDEAYLVSSGTRAPSGNPPPVPYPLKKVVQEVIALSSALTFAQDPGVKPGAQLELASSKWQGVRISLAANHALTPGALEVLLADPDGLVAEALSRNTALTPTDSWPARTALMSATTSSYAVRRAEQEGVSLSDLTALGRGFSGTLGELLDVARELGGDACDL